MRTKQWSRLRMWLAIAACVCAPSLLLAQGLFGTISGIVTDPSEAVITGATVTVTNSSTNVSVVLKTNNAGVYNASSLNPGTYSVTVQAPGFKSGMVKGITLEVSANPKEDVKLETGATSETVQVSSESALLETQQSTLGQTVGQRQLEDLPVAGSSGRSFYSLINLSAGVSQQVGAGGYALDNARINGGRPRMDDYLLDGTSSEQPTFGGPAITPSVDTISEMHVITNSFSAEYGKVSGGVITATTKSGTNHFHGSAYEYAQNAVLNAKNYFTAPNTSILPFNYNEFGGTIGGPAKKDKLFFFTDYQGVRSNSTTPIIDRLVPNAAFRNGDLSAVSTQLVDPQTKLPYANNQVPVSAISKALLALFPVGNGGPATSVVGADFWSGSGSNTSVVNRFNPRIDLNLREADHIFGVYHYQRERYSSTSQFPDANNYSLNPDDSITAGWTHIFGSTIVNDARFGYNHRSAFRTTNGYGQVSVSDFGIAGIPVCNLPNSGGKCGAPTIGIAGFTGVGGGGSMLVEPSGQTLGSDMVTKTVGKQTIKVGGEIDHVSISNIQPNSLTGNFSFKGTGTGNPFGDFLNGYLSQSSIQVQSDYLQPQTWADAIFVQDDWRLKRTLTLNLGMRWQYDPSWTAKAGQLASFNPYTLAWTQNRLNGAPAGSINTHWKEFAPRLGFAWNPINRTVFRGGYGITFPGVTGHGRGGDGTPSPSILATTQVPTGTNIASLPTVVLPNATAPLSVAQGSYTAYTPRNQAPQYVQQWNLTLSQQFGASTIFELAYTGSHGVHLPINYGYNLCQQSADEIAKYGTAAKNMDGPYCAPGSFSALGGFYGDYVLSGYWGLSSSVYNAMQVKLERRYAKGLSVLTTFTWSKLMDDSSSDYGGFGSLDVYGQDFYHRSAERSVSAGNIPYNFQLSPIYDLPFGPGKAFLNNGIAGEVLGGWRISAVYSLTSGAPLGISDGGFVYGNVARTLTTRPTLIGNPAAGPRNINQWFNTAAFDWSGTTVYSANLLHPEGNSVPQLAFGNTRRFLDNSNVSAPDYNNLNLSLQKEFKLPFGEQSSLRIQGDAFDALNHPLFASPDTNADATFGRVLSTRGGSSSRTIQLGAHLYF